MTHSTTLRVWNTMRRIFMRLPGIAAEHAFFSMLFLIAAAGVLSLFLFYVYGSRQTKQVQREASLYDFKEELFQDTLEVLEERELNLENAKQETSKDIFNPG